MVPENSVATVPAHHDTPHALPNDGRNLLAAWAICKPTGPSGRKMR